MHVAHSNIAEQVFGDKPVKKLKQMTAQERFTYQMALKGFKRACKNQAATIAEIKKYFPDYEPKFNYPVK
jgi:hypothetical protein